MKPQRISSAAGAAARSVIILLQPCQQRGSGALLGLPFRAAASGRARLAGRDLDLETRLMVGALAAQHAIARQIMRMRQRELLQPCLGIARRLAVAGDE